MTMAKKSERKNRSARERLRREQELERREAQKQEECINREMGFLMVIFSILTLLLVILSIYQSIDLLVVIAFSIPAAVYGIFCIVAYVKHKDRKIGQMATVVCLCTITLIVAGLICK